MDKEKGFKELLDAQQRLQDQNNLKLWQAIRKYPKIVGYCIGLTSAILLSGYDQVIVGTSSAMPAFQDDYGEKLDGQSILPSHWLSLWAVAGPIGLMAGGLTGGFIQDRLGRRLSLASGSIVSAIAVGICYASSFGSLIDTRRGIFLLGKLFQGYSIGILLCTTQTYMSEVAPVCLRAPLMALFPVFTLVGQLVGAMVVFASLSLTGAASYRRTFISQWPFSALPLIMALILPESPTYLVRIDRLNTAWRMQKRLDSSKEDTSANLERIRLSILMEENSSNISKATYRDCFKGTNLRRTIIVIISSFLPEFWGLSLLANASYFMQVVGMGATNSILFLQLGILLGLLSNIASTWVLTRVGRRKLILSTVGCAGVLWFGMGIAGFFNGVVTIWYTAVTMMIIVVICGVGVWPASYAVSSEVSALHLRAKTQGINWLAGGFSTAIFGLCLPYIYNPDQGNLKGKTGFVFAVLSVIAAAMTFFYVPEMKGRTAIEIDRMFELKIPARGFKGWAPDKGIEGESDVSSTERSSGERSSSEFTRVET